MNAPLLSDPAAVGDLTAEILTYLEASEPGRHWHRTAAFHDNIAEFDGAFPVSDLARAWDYKLPVMSPQEMADPAKWVAWPIDTAFCLPAASAAYSDDGDGWPDGTWMFTRMHSCGPKLARGNATLLTPRMICKTQCYVTPAGDRAPLRVFYAFSGGQWVPAYDKQLRRRVFREEDTADIINQAFTFSLTRRYCWSVCLGFQGPSIRFITDPVGVRAAFALRDVPEGASRRAALRHWVQQHSRQNRKDATALHDVRKHLRGATSFTWNGLRCRIEPSLLDQEQAAAKG